MSVNDKASGLFGTFYSVGQVMAPLIGAALYDNIGYRSTCDFLALTCVLYSVVYFSFNVGFKILEKSKKIKEEMQ